MRRVLVLLVLGACADPDPAPHAVVVSAAPDALVTADDARDDLTIVVEYTDGDADLGGGVALVHDCRADGLVTTLELLPIASDEAVAEGVPIAGTLELVVADIGLVTPAASPPAACAALDVPAAAPDSAVFCVLLQDAAGHEGSGDCTPPIALE